MAMPTCYSKFFNERIQRQQRILPSCRSIKAEDICGKISAARFSVSSYRYIFHGYKFNCLFRWCLDTWSFTDEVIGIYPILTSICSFFPPTIGRPQYFDQNNQCISSIKFFSLLKGDHTFSFSVQQV